MFVSASVLAMRAQLTSSTAVLAMSAQLPEVVRPMADPWRAATAPRQESAIVYRACWASQARHLGSLVLGCGSSQIVVQELTATAVIRVVEGLCTTLIDIS